MSDRPLSFLVDTGSCVCLIKSSSINKTPKLSDVIITLKGIDPGDDITTTLGSFQMSMFQNPTKCEHEFHVVEDISLSQDGIIGNDLLKRFGCRINYDEGILHIENNSIKLNFSEPLYTIQPRTEMVIECTVANPQIREGIILDQHVSDSLLVANCIVQVKENNRINITVVNTSDEPVSLHSNLNLKLEPIDIKACMTPSESNPVLKALNRTNEVVKLLRISHLNDEETDALLHICADYSDIFHLPDDQLTHTTVTEHTITTNTQTPIQTKTYRFPECHKEEVKKQINKMLEQNIIAPSSSPWSSPIWVVPKKADASGQRKWRVVIDYRKLNDVTVGETYPIPQITEILDQLGKSQYFSTLDLASGFHQIPISPKDAPKTAFSVPQGHYQFTRMPFGLKNAPATFQKLMNTCLSGLQGSRCFVYLDDIVVHSPDLISHIQNLSSVFDRLRSFNLKIQPDKCEFLRKEVAYLGHIITNDGVKPNPEKIKAVTDFPTPKSPKDIKSFLGLVSYYRRFIPDFSKLAKPLTSLLKKEVAFNWRNEQQLSFELLKNKLVTSPVLAYPDFTKPFILTCDASNFAVSAILSQGQIGRDRPIAYSSRTLNKAECNYSVTEKECLAIVFGTKAFRPYLYGHRFTIVTDHKPLQWLFNCKDPGSRLIRWRLKLEEFEYDIIYKKGKINTNADALSRFPVNPITNTFPDNLLTDADADLDIPDLPSPIPFSFNNEELLNQNLDSNQNTVADSTINPNLPNNLNEMSTPSPNSIDLDQLILSPQSTDLNLDFENIEITSPGHKDVRPDLNTNNDNYSDFLKSISGKKTTSNTSLTEHSENLLKTPCKIILIPTSIDLDESNPYVSEMLANVENKEEIINSEKELYSYSEIKYGDKTIYLIFTKVHYFDETPYPAIYDTLKTVRNKLLQSGHTSDIAISDFKNPFDQHSYTKIYNIITHLFQNTNISIHIYLNKIIYPSLSERQRVLRENHDIPIAGHLGSSRMYNRIREQFYWKGMRGDIEDYVKKCRQCQENKALRKLNRAPMEITTTSNAPFQRVALDIVGPLPESGTAKLKYILTLQDDLTKYSVAYPLRSTTAEETSDCLIHFISLFGIPKSILTDQGTNFTSELFKNTCQFLKIKQLWSSPYHPQTQGALERSHSTLKEYLKSFTNENQDNWPTYVYTAMLTYNTTIHTTTKFSPYELVFGHKPFIPNSIYETSSGTTYTDYIKMLQHKFKYTRSKALENILKSKEASKTYYDSRAKTPPRYKIGDYVYLKNHLRLRKALSPIWKGPYKIIRVNNNHTVTLLINRRHVTHHFDEIKPAEINQPLN